MPSLNDKLVNSNLGDKVKSEVTKQEAPQYLLDEHTDLVKTEHIKCKSDAVNKTIVWNEQRYDKIYNEKLSIALLQEEALEGMRATDHVEQLDSAGDMLFVAIGILWKCGYLDTCESRTVLNWSIRNHSIDSIKLMLGTDIFFNPKTGVDQALVMMEISFNIIEDILHINGFNAEDVLNIICASNETKRVPKNKVDPGVKANRIKGADFVSPKDALFNLINNKNISEEFKK